MPSTVLIEGPFESDYSLSIVNRNLAYGMLDTGCAITLHQRDNIRAYPPSSAFLRMHPRLAAHFQEPAAGARPDIHTRYIYPPYCDSMTGSVRAFHCYGWEESAFPRRYAMGFESGLDLVTVMSRYVMQDLLDPQAGGVAGAYVGAGFAQRAGDRVADLVGNLRSARGVKEGEPRLQRREAPAHALQVTGLAEHFGHWRGPLRADDRAFAVDGALVR